MGRSVDASRAVRRVRRRRARPRGAGPVAALLAVAAAVAACGESELFGPEIPAEVEEFVSLANAHRASVGCPPLVWSPAVAAVAQAHSEDMVERGYFAHTNPDGASPFDRLRAAGIDYAQAAENIAWGYPTAQAVLDGWLGSPGHRANLERCSLTEHGVGLAETRWTHLFVTP